MTFRWMKPMGAALIAGGILFAQTAMTKPDRRAEFRQHIFNRIATHLNLTDAQKEQAKAILKDAHQSAMALAPQMKQSHEALAEAVKSGKPDTEIARLASEQGALVGRMIAIRTQAMAKIYQTLTPEQRTKAEEMLKEFRSRFQQHFHSAPQS